MAKGDHLQIFENTKPYLQRGVVQFDKLLAIPLAARIPNLTHVYGLEAIHKILAAMLTKFNNDLNLIRPMSAMQIESCSFELVLTTEEDFLSVEDYVLFFKGAIEGKYGKIFDRLDQQTIFQLLEQYRQERYATFLCLKEEKEIQYKGMGTSERISDRNEIAEAMSSLAGKIGELKEKLKVQREINMANRL